MENNALYYSIVPIAVYISLAGNIIGIVCVLKRKLQSIKTKFILKCLFAVDFIYLLKTLIEFAMINLEYQSIFPCKFFYYLSYFSFDPWFLLLITTIVLIFKLKCKYFFSLTMTCILLNLSHLALSLPLTLVLNSDLKFSVNNVYLSFILYNSNFGIDFYIIFFFNLKFRHELLLSNSQSNEQILLRNF